MGMVVVMLTGGAVSSWGEPVGIPPLEESIRQLPTLDFCGEPVPLEDPDVRERMDKELLLSLWDRDQAVLWLKRSTRYFPLIEKMLSEAGLPDDLKYVDRLLAVPAGNRPPIRPDRQRRHRSTPQHSRLDQSGRRLLP